MSLYESVFQCKYHRVPHTQSFQGGIKPETTLRLAVPWPQLFTDEKKSQGGVTGELTPRRFQCSSDLVCDYLKFRLSENHQSQAMLLRCYLFSCAKLQPVNTCLQAPGGEKGPCRGVRDAHQRPWRGRCETAFSAFTILPSTSYSISEWEDNLWCYISCFIVLPQNCTLQLKDKGP